MSQETHKQPHPSQEPVEPVQEQPVAPPQPMPQPIPQPMQQPVQPQYGQPQPVMQQPVQYVVMQQSLKGVGGWLIFWLIAFALSAIVYIWSFFGAMMVLGSAVGVVSLIFSPILAGSYITTIVLIAMQKRLAILVTYITIGLSAAYSLILSIVSYLSVSNAVNAIRDYSYSSSYSSYDRYLNDYSSPNALSSSLPILIGGILVSLTVHGLVILYFVLSKRVKETLVN